MLSQKPNHPFSGQQLYRDSDSHPACQGNSQFLLNVVRTACCSCHQCRTISLFLPNWISWVLSYVQPATPGQLIPNPINGFPVERRGKYLEFSHKTCSVTLKSQYLINLHHMTILVTNEIKLFVRIWSFGNIRLSEHFFKKNPVF